MVDAAALAKQGRQPGYLARQSLRARLAEECLDALSLTGIRMGEEVSQDERAFALEQVAADLLTVARAIARQVQDVVLDLKGGAQEISETVEPVEVPAARVGNQRADACRVNEAVPPGLFEHHEEIVVLGGRAIVIADPAELHRLALDGLERHMIEFIEQPPCELGAEPWQVLAQDADAERIHRIADVERDG